MRITALLLVFLTQFSFAQTNSIVGPGKKVDPYNYSAHKNHTYEKASVASAHPLASQVGAAIMEKGGNAFDAAVATQLALAVVYPGAGNIGGGGFLLGRKTNGQLVCVEYREKAPGKSNRDMYLDSAGNAINDLSKSGHLASGVPGTVAGLFTTMKYAKLTFAQLIEPAIDLAEKGFVITAREARGLNNYRKDFIHFSTKPGALVKVNGEWKEGDTLIQPELAKTLKRMREKGQAGFYEGETAKLIVEEMDRGKGLITLADLKNYKAVERQPILFTYRGHTVISFPPPSSGGLLIAQMLKMIEPYDVAAQGFQSPASVQLMIEAERRAYADRAEHMGDPDFYKVPLQSLMSNSYLKERMKDYDPTKASVSANVKAGIPKESDQTTHISIMDRYGNMVAITTTLNGGYGSRTIVGGAGFLLNNEMDDFSVKPGVPNMYGAVGGEANSIVPEKRMLSSMTPTLVLKDKKPFMVVGTPGGTTIPTSVFQSIVNVIDFSMNAEDAVKKPKFHHQWLPDEVLVEKTFDANTKAALLKMGYKLKETSAIGRTELILFKNGKKQTAADSRGDDSVAGF